MRILHVHIHFRMGSRHEVNTDSMLRIRSDEGEDDGEDDDDDEEEDVRQSLLR